MGSFTNNRIVQITFDGSVAGTLSGNCKGVILSASQACYVNFNLDTVAIATGFYIPANTTVEIELAHIAKIAAIKATSGGTLTILELF